MEISIVGAQRAPGGGSIVQAVVFASEVGFDWFWREEARRSAVGAVGEGQGSQERAAKLQSCAKTHFRFQHQAVVVWQGRETSIAP